MGFNPIRGVKNFFRDVRNAPDAQYITSTAAETQFPSEQSLVVPEKVHYLERSATLTQDFSHSTFDDELPPRAAAQAKKEGGALDKVVNAAGSRWALGIVLLLLVAWGVWGVIINATDTWQVVLQDVSSLQAYFSATLLMRQQNNNTRGLLNRICNLISRSKSNERMVRSLTSEQKGKLATSTQRVRNEVLQALQTKEDGFDKFANGVAKVCGSLPALTLYTLAIIAWVFLGIPSQFSDTWQLWVNTGTALEITFITMFLQNIRRQHELHMDKTVKSIEALDREVEMQLRRITGDMTPNPTIPSSPPTLSVWVRAIDIYAYIIAGSIGLTISAIVLSVWIAIGDPMDFDDNWFLIIGTYTGLIGFVDGFVLNNVDEREASLAEKHFKLLLEQDSKIFSGMGIQTPLETPQRQKNLSQRIAGAIGHACGSTVATYLCIFSVFALLGTASALQWTETAQLLCNTPTMIFEGFTLILLLQAHNMDDEKRRLIYEDILNRRLILDKHVAAGTEDQDVDGLDYNEKDGGAIQTFPVNGVDVEMGRQV